jgi:orotate phosphoribosyltransferase
MNNEAMQAELIQMLAPRKGHFRFESGHHGECWLEIARLYLRPSRLQPFVDELARRIARHDVQAVCGPLIEGAFLAQMIAQQLDVEFYFAEQFFRTPNNDLYPVSYRIPQALRLGVQGKGVAVVDDVINAGSAVGGTLKDLQACGARPAAIGALLLLGTTASTFAAGQGIPLENLASLPNLLWEPSACPLCAQGVPLDGAAGSSP